MPEPVNIQEMAARGFRPEVTADTTTPIGQLELIRRKVFDLQREFDADVGAVASDENLSATGREARIAELSAQYLDKLAKLRGNVNVRSERLRLRRESMRSSGLSEVAAEVRGLRLDSLRRELSELPAEQVIDVLADAIDERDQLTLAAIVDAPRWTVRRLSLPEELVDRGRKALDLAADPEAAREIAQSEDLFSLLFTELDAAESYLRRGEEPLKFAS